MVFNLRSFSFTDSDEDDRTRPRSFSLKELRAATQNFSRDNYFVGGGFGMVYWGRLADSSLVAVKRAITIGHEREEAFKREVQVASSVPTHPNVPRLWGFCRTKKELFLVYPLMIHYSRAYCRRERPDWSPRPLDWMTRKRIALGAARGLAHQLHNQSNVSVIHRRFSLPSIWLNFLSKAETGNLDTEDERNSDKGTIEWHALKSDVFAFGKTLLHLICGQKSKEFGLLEDENLSLEKWINRMMSENKFERVIDPNLWGNYVEEEAKQLVRLALLCTDTNPSVQPHLSQVVRMLGNELLVQEQDPSGWHSRSRSSDSTTYYSFPSSPSSEIALRQARG
ncbi:BRASSINOSTEROID INSENSITIVE 1-associated receptor kinase 1-like [Syzygium oleosum]|uniref:BRASSINOSTEROID INSENSITIVE 1-associated receptor kinase 1-like n=1 Tax=Syzygium oleosum TaxID=219896 RepID=UPI0024B9BC71|nr:BRASSINOSTEROID INSENSITIVE 1-associated receptor kinase 1-like [Syzygium oleosum]